MVNSYKVKVPAMTGDDQLINIEAENETDAKRNALSIIKSRNPDFVKKGNIEILEAANDSDSNESTELAVLEAKSLVEMLSVSDQLPADFYTNDAYQQQLISYIELTNNLVYPLTDEGDKEARLAATGINQTANKFNSFVKAVVDRETKSVTDWKAGWKKLIDQFLANRQAIIDQREEKKKERLALCEKKLTEALDYFLDSKSVKPEYRSNLDIKSVIKLGSLTEKGDLTKGATAFVTNLANECLAEQTRIESRILQLENACLKAEITPLQKEHFGSVFYADESLFQEKLQELINVELERKAEMEAKARKRIEAEHQQKLDQELAKQRAEIEKVEAEKMAAAVKAAEELRTPKPDLVSNNYGVHSENIVAKKQEERDDKRNFVQTSEPVPTVAKGRKLVRFSIRFELSVPESYENTRLEEQVKNLLPAKLRDALIRFVFTEVS